MRHDRQAADLAAALDGVVEEINALLRSNRFRCGDHRWLSGRLVEVLISPLKTAGDERAVVLTFHPTRARRSDLAGLTVRLRDANGQEREATLDAEGPALLSVRTDTYQLSLDPAEVGASVKGVEVPRARRHAHGFHAGPGRGRPVVGERRPRRSRREVLLLQAAAAMALVGLVATMLVDSTPARARVDVRQLSGECPDPAEGAGRTVDIVATWGGEEKLRFEQVLDRFATTTGISVTFASSKPPGPKEAYDPDRDLAATLRSRIEKGCPPGVALVPQTGLVRDLAGRNQLIPLEPVAGALVDENYNPAWRELGSVDGDLYGVWFKASDKSLVWYNVAAFREAGVAVPATWSELKEAAARLHGNGITPFSIAGRDEWTLTDWFENVYLRTAGREMYDKLARGEIAWTDASVRTALLTLAEIFGHADWLAGGRDGSLATTYEASVSKVFDDPARPEAAMVFEGDFVANVIADTPSVLGEDARSFPFPSIGPSAPGPVVGGGAATIAGEATGGDVAVLLTDDPDARELIRYLATPAAAEPWMRAGGFLSPNKRANLDHYREPASRAAATGLVNATSLSFDLSDQMPVDFGGTPGRGMFLRLQEFLHDPSDVEGVARRLQEDFEAARPVP